MVYIAYIPLFVFTIISIRQEIIKKECFITPYVLLIFPNFLILTLCIFIGPLFGFYRVHYYFVFIILLFSITFYVFEMVFFTIQSKVEVNDFFSFAVEFFSILLVIYEFQLLLRLIHSHGFYYLLTEDFTLRYARGVSGHSLIFLQLFSGYHLAKFKCKHNLAIYIAIIVLNFATGVFHWVAFAVVNSLIYATLTHSIRLDIKKIVILSLIGIILFVGSYAVVVINNALQSRKNVTQETFKEIFGYVRHFFNYLFSGILCASIKYENGIVDKSFEGIFGIAAPVYNTVKILIPSLDIDIYEKLRTLQWAGKGMVIISKYGGYSNVSGIFGNMMLRYDILSSFLFLMITAMLSSMFFILSKRYRYLSFYSCFFCVGLFFNWFNNFYNISEFYETLFLWTPFVFLGDKFFYCISKYALRLNPKS